MTESGGRFAVALGGRYTIERELGRGGMATVFLAHDERHHRLVALKVLRAELTNAIGSERFTQEIRIVAGLHHPHILAVFDSGEAEGVLYYVMPYVSGETLRHRLERERQLPLEDALCIAEESADALAYAHERGIIHRDIKPENILLSDGHASVADFGIARVMQNAADDRLTAVGLIVGTPAYMSPEQATGEREVDGRSDIYSLGCVLFEMLAGEPPFRGQNAQAVVMQHITTEARPLRQIRPSVSPAVEAIVMRALAKVPADRFSSAREMVAALRNPEGGTRPSIQVAAVASKGPSAAWRRRSKKIAIGSVAALALVVAGMFAAQRALRAPLSPTTFALTTPAASQTAKDASARLHEAMREWTGARAVALDYASSSTRALAIGAARAQRAGRLVMTEVERAGDSANVIARVFDTSADTVLREARVRTSLPIALNDARIAALAAAVVRETGPATPEDAGTRSVAAVNAYDRGRTALALWALDSAERLLREATKADPDFAKANLWLAQTLAWQKRVPIEDLRAAASRAASLASRLGAHDSISALALDAFAAARYPDACASYGELIQHNASDVIGLLGRAQCNDLDSLVVPDKGSPSGFAFRSSWHTAASAYQRALQLNPNAYRAIGVERLQHLLFTDAFHLRPGHSDAGESFTASPALRADTLAFVPYSARLSAVAPPIDVGAIDRNKRVLRDIAAAWVRAEPSDAGAHTALAQALERTGELEHARQGEPGALERTRSALALTTDSATRLNLANDEVRLLVKSKNFTQARTVAESLLAAHPSPTPVQAAKLAPLAALTGHVARLVALAKQAAATITVTTDDSRAIAVPPELLEESQGLLAYASVGVPKDSIRARLERVEQGLARAGTPAQQQVMRYGLLTHPLSLAVPALGAKVIAGERAGADYLIPVQQAVARGDTKGARGLLATIDSLRRGGLPGDVTIDAVYQESWLLAAIGDTARAAVRLDASLQSLNMMDVGMLEHPFTAAALVRAMLLRGDLATAMRDHTTAQLWQKAAAELWAGADEPLLTLVSRRP